MDAPCALEIPAVRIAEVKALELTVHVELERNKLAACPTRYNPLWLLLT
jgi:hypothetical protein